MLLFENTEESGFPTLKVDNTLISLMDEGRHLDLAELFNKHASDSAYSGDISAPEKGSDVIKSEPERRRTRDVLPIKISGNTDSLEVKTCPDSGSDENIISLDLVRRLGLDIQKDQSGQEPMHFSIANGKIIEAIGQVAASCAFVGPASDDSVFQCIFHVFSSLAVSAIMGMQFLRQTETLGRHKDRLVKEVVPSMQALQVKSIGRSKQSLVCRFDSYVGWANADTGSDLDLVSSEFARSRGFAIEPACEKLEFADCSVGFTTGVIRAPFTVGHMSDEDGFLPHGMTMSLDVYVLEDLTVDILLGQSTVENLDIFGSYAESFVPSIPQLGQSDVNIIRHIGVLEHLAKHSWNMVKEITQRGTSREDAGGKHKSITVA